MINGLEIVRIQVGTAEPRGIPNPKTGEIPRWLPIAIKVHNPNTAVTLYAVSRLLRYHYDPPTHLLDLWFKEPEEDPDPAVNLHFMVPSFKQVDPGVNDVIEASVPAVINLITDISRAGVTVEQLPAEEMERIHCVIAYDVEPFRPSQAVPSADKRWQMSQWGQVAEATLKPDRTGQAEVS